MKRIASLLTAVFPLLLNGQLLEYPATPKQPVTDSFYTTTICDEYRWLENIYDEKTQSWIDEQNKLTRKTLRKAAMQLNSFGAIDSYAYVKYDNPIKKGDYFFKYAYHTNVTSPALFYQTSINGQPAMLVDPAMISAKQNILIQNYSVSGDSKYLAYQFSRDGSDWGEIKVVNLKTGNHIKDYLKNVKFSNIAWKDDGFYYSRYPEEELGKTIGQQIFYHKIGTSQQEDKLIFRRSNNPEAFFSVTTTEDERFFLLKEEDEKKGLINIFYIDFQSQMPALRPLLTRLGLDENLNIIDNHGQMFIATSFKDNNNGMIVKIDPANPREWKVIVPEYESALLLETKLLHDKIIAIYQANRKQQIVVFNYQGKLLHAINLPFGYSAKGFNGKKTDEELLFSYAGYTQPKIIYKFNTASFEMKPLRATVVNFDFTQFETKELEYTSFDGTKVPLFMIYHKETDITTENPLLLTAYGGFGSVSTPGFNPGIVHFLKEGGIYGYANIRGGGDKGKEWALKGRGKYKQNSFNDFIAAAEFVINNNYTSSNKLAITGGSNGGLVVGVAMTQRPELFKVAVPVVAPFDMIRFEKFTIGHFHTDEYGSVSDSAGFCNLMSYSPLHNIGEDVNYPATLIMTSDHDDRVPPLHSYKFAAKLQSRKAQKNPVLLRVEKGAGHYGATGSFKRYLQEQADMYDFILYHLSD